MSNDSQEVIDQKEVAFYAAGVQAWFETRFEKDKSLLTLSAGGIALMLTLFTTVGADSVLQLVLYFMSIFAFIGCLFTVLAIFSRNADYLQKLVQNEVDSDPCLAFLDKLAVGSFLIGVILATLVGGVGAINRFDTERKTAMSERKPNVPSNGRSEDLIRSLDGAGALRPRPSGDQTQKPLSEKLEK